MTEKATFLSGDNGVTEKIKRAMYDAARQFVYIGFLLYEVEIYKYYQEHGYANVYEYAEAELNFKRTSTKNFIAVAETFGGGSMNLQKEYSNYGYSQLTEMLSMSPAQRKQVTPDMTVKSIREIKKKAADELQADNYIMPKVAEATVTMMENPAQETKLKLGQTSDQKETVVINNVWRKLSKASLDELRKVAGINKKKKYEIRIKGEEEESYDGIRHYTEWNSVNDRLPSDEKIRLVVTKTKSGIKDINRAYYANEKWYVSGSMDRVTHWATMPPLPKE